MFNLTEQQILIQQSAERYMDEQFDFRKHQDLNQTELGFDKAQWQQFSDLGWLGIGIPESCGGFGGSIVDISLLCQQQARRLLMTPFTNTIGISAQALLLAANSQQLDLYISSIISGDAIMTCAFNETEEPNSLNISTSAVKKNDNYVINGCKRLVPWGAQSNYFIVNTRESDQCSLFIIAAETQGVNLLPYKLYDGSRACDIEFCNVHISSSNKLENGSTATIDQINDVATALLCTEASAIMWAIHEQTLEYIKTREQFGQTLGAMQALQHRIVDMYVQCQLSQSMAEDAVNAMTESYAKSASHRISAAKTFIGQNGRKVGKDGIQLHGGIGMTDDLPIGHYFKRLSAIEQMLGNTTWHLQRCLALDQLTESLKYEKS